MDSLKNQDSEKSTKTQTKSQASLVKELLAQYLGVEPEDINENDSLIEDLHIKVTDLVDFVESLSEHGLDTTNIDLPGIDTVQDLIESLFSDAYLTP